MSLEGKLITVKENKLYITTGFIIVKELEISIDCVNKEEIIKYCEGNNKTLIDVSSKFNKFISTDPNNLSISDSE
jgi:hypothetical protein